MRLLQSHGGGAFIEAIAALIVLSTAAFGSQPTRRDGHVPIGPIVSDSTAHSADDIGFIMAGRPSPTPAPIWRRRPTAAPTPAPTWRENIATICHKTADPEPLNYRTITISKNDLPAHQRHGDLIGSCEDDVNSQALCFGKEGIDPIIRGDALECRNKYSPGTPVAALVVGGSSELTVKSCTPDTVEVQSSHLPFMPGDFFIYDAEGEVDCSSCNPLYRRIVSIQEGQEVDTKIFRTEFMNVENMYNPGDYDASFDTTEVEPLVCSNGGDKSLRSLISFPDQCSDWRQVDTDGSCTHTDCFVGQGGSGANCFSCGTGCDNGCGASGGLSFSGDFLFWDFGSACCSHDHCYSSASYGKVSCDLQMHKQFMDACRGTIAPGVPPLFFLWTLPLHKLACATTANTMFSLVLVGGWGAHTKAQKSQSDHEEQPVCNFCKEYLLNLTDRDLFELAHAPSNTKRIGQYCFVNNNVDKPGACDYYAKGRPRPDLGDGVPPNLDGGGTGCVKSGSSFCFMDTLTYLTQEEKASMCTEDHTQNGGAQMRWAILNDFCTDVGVKISTC